MPADDRAPPDGLIEESGFGGDALIYYLTSEKHPYTMRDFLAGLGKPLADIVRVFDYTEFARIPRLPARATYVFSDVDRLSGSQSSNIFDRWKRLQDAGARVLNHPLRVMRRYDLLRWAYEAGINSFDCYMVIEHRKPKRFPVFMRRAFDHEGSISPLIHNQAELDRAIAAMRAASEWPGDKIVTEYIDVSDKDGVFRKYAAFRIGDTLFPRQIMAAKQWVVKKPEFDSAELAAQEAAYVDANPHGEQLMRIFEAARIEYGRIDYCVVDGRVQVFEINTNPSIIGASSTAQVLDPTSLRGPTYRKMIDKYIEAFAALDVRPNRGKPGAAR